MEASERISNRTPLHSTLTISSREANRAPSLAEREARRPGTEPATGEPAPHSGRSFSAGGAGARILIVDDEPVNRMILEQQLARDNFEATEVAGGADALRCLDTQEFDLVLLDIMMPLMSGYEVCRELRQRFSVEELPVIFLTAMNHLDDIVDGFAAGGNDYLSKPFHHDELLARIHIQLALLEAHRKLECRVKMTTAQIEALCGFLPICAVCKRIRDDHGHWDHRESYIERHSATSFSHEICPDCAEKSPAGRESS